jgi:hypothetical protein
MTSVGAYGDVSVIECGQVHLVDEQRLLSSLTYPAAGADVDSFFVGGRPVA